MVVAVPCVVPAAAIPVVTVAALVPGQEILMTLLLATRAVPLLQVPLDNPEKIGTPESVRLPEKVGVPVIVPDKAAPLIVGVVRVELA
jgi:hypothetical protein